MASGDQAVERIGRIWPVHTAAMPASFISNADRALPPGCRGFALVLLASPSVGSQIAHRPAPCAALEVAVQGGGPVELSPPVRTVSATSRRCCCVSSPRTLSPSFQKPMAAVLMPAIRT